MSKALVTASDSSFLPGARALLLSAARQCPEVKRYCFVPAEEKAAMESGLGDLAVIVTADILSAIPVEYRMNAGRIFTSQVEEDTAAYFDADMVVCGNVDKVWDVRQGRVNAVQDDAQCLGNNLSAENRIKYAQRFPELVNKKGFNGGLFAIRTSENRDLPEKFCRLITDTKLRYDYILDQPVLNAVFQPNVDYLPFKYNSHCIFDRKIPRDVRVVHYTSKSKPWMPDFPKHEPAYWYWLKYGLPQAGPVTLIASRLWIIAHTPKRLAGRMLRGMGKGKRE